MEEIKLFFNENLKFLTQTTSINQYQLAQKMELSKQAINEYINKNKFPTYPNLIKISRIYNLTLEELLLKDLKKERNK